MRVSSLLLTFSCLSTALFTCLLGALKNVNKTLFFTSIIGAISVVHFPDFIGLILWVAIDFGHMFCKILTFYNFIAKFIVIDF